MSEFFEKGFYGNTIGEWSVSLLIILSGIIIAKIVYWIISKFVKRLTKKTKTKLDDIIVDMIEEPIVFAIIIASIWYGIMQLTLPEAVMSFISKTYFFLIIINISWLITRLLDAMIQEYIVPLVEKSESDLDDQLLPIMRKGLKLTVWIVAIIIGFDNAGYDVGALIAGLGIGGFAIAMAAKDTVANLFGGLTVFSDKPFKLHDRVLVDGFDGTIEEIGIRSTRLKTLEGRIVTIPNAKFASDSIENISSENSRKVVVNLGLTYDTDDKGIETALNILKDIANKHKSVKENPIAGFKEFADFSLVILFIYYIEKGESILETNTQINLEIMRQFSKAGLDMAFPTQTIYTKS